MPDNIPFSIGLESLPLDTFQTNNSANGNMYNSSFGTSISAGGASYTGGIIDINAPTVEDNVYITDASLKQVYIEMTVFQSFPVQMEDGKYTYIPDKTSRTDGAGTNKGGLSYNCNSGICGFCDNFDESILDAQIGNVTNFKIGASIGHDYGTKYLKKFYPEVAWSSSDFGNLKKDGFFIAEMVIPISATQGKPVRCTLVDNGPFHKWAIDVMGSFCLLNEVKDLFKIKAVKADNSTLIVGDTVKFPFADKKYDYINGEIPGFSPEAVKSWVTSSCLYNNVKTSPFKAYYGEVIAGPKRPDNGHSMIRVKFYIDPSKKEAAEKKIGKSLPDALFKPNYDGEVVDISETLTIANSNITDNSSIWERIYDSGVRISQLLRQRAAQNPGAPLYKVGRNLVRSNDNNFIVVSQKGTDCSGGAFWILVNAGIILPEGIAMGPPITGYMRSWKNGWPPELKLAPGIKAVPVPINSVQPGDLILWDRNKESNNHLMIYAGQGKAFDFGNENYVKAQQPVSRSHISSSPRGSNYYVYSYGAWRFVATNTNETPPAAQTNNTVEST